MYSKSELILDFTKDDLSLYVYVWSLVFFPRIFHFHVISVITADDARKQIRLYGIFVWKRLIFYWMNLHN